MGQVFAALDERLERQVALKLLLAEAGGEEARERFWREAKLAAQLSHPNICQIYDVGEHESQPYLAMELLEGEPLSDRIAQGPLDVRSALRIIGDILGGLEALHQRDIVHRDLKPSNVFLVGSGAKLLDFGLARSLAPTDVDLTQPGLLLGTPRYMAPEQWKGEAVSPATDLFAASSILYEMLSGSYAFDGESPIALYTAILSEQPPALTGTAAIDAIDRVIHRGLSKRDVDRYESAVEMRAALDGASVSDDQTLAQLEVRQVTRLIVLPFRLLRADDDIDFLPFSLADAVTASLSGLRSLVVRSQAVAAETPDGRPDLDALARESDVEAALFGTLLRAGNRVRLSTQLVQVPDGTVLATNTAEAGLDDIFSLQDELAEAVVRSLEVPLGDRQAREERREVAPDGKAYELYLRANQLAKQTLSPSRLMAARDLYQESLEHDPDFASAWAQLGRVFRVQRKYGYDEDEANRPRAAEAFDRALQLNPKLALAHNVMTYFQIEEQSDAAGAMERLLERLTEAPDPDLFAGLVTACRFCGLTDASIAAHNEASRLDSKIASSVAYTYWVLGDFERARETEGQDIPYVQFYIDATEGRVEKLRELSGAADEHLAIGATLLRAQLFAVEGDFEGCRAAVREIRESSFDDPEGLYFAARTLVQVGDIDDALEMLESIRNRGYHCLHLMSWDPVLSRLDTDERFVQIVRKSRNGSDAARQRFDAAGGPGLLGL